MAVPNKKDVYYGKYVENLPSLVGKNVAITGTTSGTGYWAAVAVVRKNAATLFCVNRESERSRASVEKLLKEKDAFESGTEIIPIDCDLMSFDSVRKAAIEINDLFSTRGGLHVLANNAGISFFPDQRTKDGFEVQMQTNHLSHFLLTKLLFPSFQLALDAGQEVRICQHSSGARAYFSKEFEDKYYQKSGENTLGGNGITAAFKRYRYTKLSNSLLTMKLHKELLAHGFDVTKIKSVAGEPGLSTTDLGRNLVAANEKAGITKKWTFRIFIAVFEFAQRYLIPSQSAADGAMPLLEACFAESVDSGDFFYPEKSHSGLPFKGIAKAEKVAKNFKREAATMNQDYQDKMWNLSEEAIGEKFFV